MQPECNKEDDIGPWIERTQKDCTSDPLGRQEDKIGSIRGLCSRERYWEELGGGERVERLRAVVKALLREINRLSGSIDTLERHGHDQKGDMTLPYHGIGPTPECSSTLPWNLRTCGEAGKEYV